MYGIKLAVIGSRGYDDYNRMVAHINRLRPSVIISGGARGADTLAKKYAEDHRLVYIDRPADWDRHGKRASAIRNKQIAKECDELMAFWDGKSPGTRMTLGFASELRKPIHIIWF